jgi:hypothetical protein
MQWFGRVAKARRSVARGAGRVHRLQAWRDDYLAGGMKGSEKVFQSCTASSTEKERRAHHGVEVQRAGPK